MPRDRNDGTCESGNETTRVHHAWPLAARAQQAESAVGRAVLSGAHNRGETWHFDGPSERLNHSRLEPQ
jgi:hypothetical protein